MSWWNHVVLLIETQGLFYQLTNRSCAKTVFFPGNSSQSLKAIDLLPKWQNVDLNIETTRADFLLHFKKDTAEPIKFSNGLLKEPCLHLFTCWKKMDVDPVANTLLKQFRIFLCWYSLEKVKTCYKIDWGGGGGGGRRGREGKGKERE